MEKSNQQEWTWPDTPVEVAPGVDPELTKPECGVEGCSAAAAFSVLLSDLSVVEVKKADEILFSTPFLQQDYTCPFLCAEHAFENEARARGLPTPNGRIEYPYTNRRQAKGFSLYMRLNHWLLCSDLAEPKVEHWHPVPKRPVPPRRCDWSSDVETDAANARRDE
jgi:hypothetical protein